MVWHAHGLATAVSETDMGGHGIAMTHHAYAIAAHANAMLTGSWYCLGMTKHDTARPWGPRRYHGGPRHNPMKPKQCTVYIVYDHAGSSGYAVARTMASP